MYKTVKGHVFKRFATQISIAVINIAQTRKRRLQANDKGKTNFLTREKIVNRSTC